MDIETIRADTPLTASTIYLDTAAASLPPDPVLEEVREYLLATGHTGIYLPAFRKATYARVEAVRAGLAELLNSSEHEIAFTKNATESICIVAQGIEWKPGDEVLVADTEMLSNLLPWKRLEKSRGIVVKMVAADGEGLLSPAAFAAAITPRTRLLTFSHLPNSSGAVQPAEAICAVAQANGLLSLVNAAQSVGMLQTDVRRLGCDFLAGCGRKALRAIEGSGFLYVRRDRIESIEPPLVGWWNGHHDSRSGLFSLAPEARRFEAGCPIVPAILALGSAIAYAQRIGIEAIEARVRELTTHAVRQLSGLPGIELYGPDDATHRIGIVPFNFRGLDPAHIVAYLERENCVMESGSFMADAILARCGVSTMARISLHYFNTHEEIDRAVELIEAAAARCGPFQPS